MGLPGWGGVVPLRTSALILGLPNPPATVPLHKTPLGWLDSVVSFAQRAQPYLTKSVLRCKQRLQGTQQDQDSFIPLLGYGASPGSPWLSRQGVRASGADVSFPIFAEVG